MYMCDTTLMHTHTMDVRARDISPTTTHSYTHMCAHTCVHTHVCTHMCAHTHLFKGYTHTHAHTHTTLKVTCPSGTSSELAKASIHSTRVGSSASSFVSVPGYFLLFFVPGSAPPDPAVVVSEWVGVCVHGTWLA